MVQHIGVGINIAPMLLRFLFIMCCLSQLFWLTIASPSKCSEILEPVGNVKSEDWKIIINRLTPFPVSQEILSNVSLCTFHKAWLTVRHPSLKQNSCCIESNDKKCKFSADKKQRVSLEVSRHIFVTTAQHIPCGSGICNSHRKDFSKSVKETQQKKDEDVDKFEASVDEKADHLNNEVVTTAKELTNVLFSSTGSTLGETEFKSRDPTEEVLTKKDSFCLDASNRLNVSRALSATSISSSLTDSQQLPCSQSSNWSTQSEAAPQVMKMDRDEKISNIGKVKALFEELGILFPRYLTSGIDVHGARHYLKSTAGCLSQILKGLVDLMVLKCEDAEKAALLAMISAELGSDFATDSKAKLSLNMMDSIRDYYQLALADLTRSGISTRRILLESISGYQTRDSHQLSQLAESIGARKQTLLESSRSRTEAEEKKELKQLVLRLGRKPPEGEKYVSLDWVIKAGTFYELETSSDVCKGHNQMHKEKIRISKDDVKILLRQKRILKVPLNQMLEKAKLDMNWPFSLRSLMSVRPDWILLPKSRYILGCLCEVCQNPTLLLRALSQFVSWVRLHGSGPEKASIATFENIPSMSAFLDLVLHPKCEDKPYHDYKCFSQECSTEPGACGVGRLAQMFSGVLSKLGLKKIEYLEHQKLMYQKSDGTQGSKIELVRVTATVQEAFDKLSEKVFSSGRETFLMHSLKKVLSSDSRKELRKNLGDQEAIVYSDYSKEVTLTSPENVKSAAFGASNQTLQLIPQVWEMTMKVPSQPTHLRYEDERLSFATPLYNGGGRISKYEVHIRESSSDAWFLLGLVQVKLLSAEPDLNPVAQGLLNLLRGTFSVRVAARNVSGLGECSEIVALLKGDSDFNPKEHSRLEDDHFERAYHTYWEEFLFLSDHGDSPKDWKTIRGCVLFSLANIRSTHNCQIQTLYHVTDTGGENWGVQPLSLYSWSHIDYKVKSVWCPTTSNHSGQPSDSAGGTFKRWLLNECKAGHLCGLNTAKQIVEYCQQKPMFSEVNQTRFLAANTTRKVFHNVTRAEIENPSDVKLFKNRAVAQFPGQPLKLLVRSRICCCLACLRGDFFDCSRKEYVDMPKEILLKLEKPSKRLTRAASPEVTNDSTDSARLLFTAGQYYSIKADVRDFNDGYCVAKALECSADYFVGSYLEETSVCPDEGKVFFKETKTKGKFWSASVLSCILSVTSVGVAIVSIEKSEIDEILCSTLED